MIVYRRMGLVFGEVFYEPVPADVPRLDILRVTSPDRPAATGSRVREARTLVIDLLQPEDALFAGMDKTTRYEVRRAMARDDLAYHLDVDGSEPEIARFCTYHDRFAATRGRRPVFRTRLHALARHGMLALSRAEAGDRDVLVWHAYLRCPGRVILLYSASLFRERDDPAVRAMIGRANRFAHWSDILAFRRMGINIYDLGGLDTAARSPETANIARFKQGFGGVVVPVYSQVLPVSLPGRLACRTLAFLGREL